MYVKAYEKPTMHQLRVRKLMNLRVWWSGFRNRSMQTHPITRPMQPT